MTAGVRPYAERDLPAMARIWNEVVADGVAFPQTDELDARAARVFFAAQSHCGVYEDAGEVHGLYILHPNNIGRCGHIANASYAVGREARGRGIGEALVRDSLSVAARLGFRLMQFNAVVKSNAHALRIYEKLGFTKLGVIPGGFLMKDGHYEDIALFFKQL